MDFTEYMQKREEDLEGSVFEIIDEMCRVRLISQATLDAARKKVLPEQAAMFVASSLHARSLDCVRQIRSVEEPQEQLSLLSCQIACSSAVMLLGIGLMKTFRYSGNRA